MLAATVFVTAVVDAGEQAKPPRPNIVVIVADDLGFGDLGCYGHPRTKTPHLDRLAAEGTRFTQFYTSAVCSPTRVSMLTGQFPSRWNIHAPITWLTENAKLNMPDWLDSSAPTLPHALRQAGYRTALFGKWHLGGGSGQTFGGKAISSRNAPPASAYGFDETRVYVGNGPTWRGTQLAPAQHEIYSIDDREFMRWSSRLIADAAIDYLERRKTGEPFYLSIHFHDPHVPHLPTDEMLAPYADIADTEARAHAAVITDMDAQIGRILARMDELGLRENTLVAFMSDNGAPARTSARSVGKDFAGTNGPLRGWKWHLYEGGIRVPFIARWPHHLPEGKVDTSSVLNVCDLVPTFTRASGARMPEGYRSDGVDITAALTGKPFVRNAPMYWHLPSPIRRGPPLAMRDGNWKLLMEVDGTEAELYDLDADPGERRNLAGTEPSVMKKLQGQLRSWHRSLPAPLERVSDAARPGPQTTYIPNRSG